MRLKSSSRSDMKWAVVIMRSRWTRSVRGSSQSRKKVGLPGTTSVSSSIRPSWPAMWAAVAPSAQNGSG